MNDLNELLEEAKSSVGPGWWPIIDEYLPQMFELAQEAIIQTREQYGTLHIRVFTKDSAFRDKISLIEKEVECVSARVCQKCGGPRKLRWDRGWSSTLCDSCAAKE